jgi:hypothetical protein
MSADIIQFIPRARTVRTDSDFPTIVFKGPDAPANAHERAIIEDTAPSEYCAPEQDPA